MVDDRFKPSSIDTGRTLGWKLLLESAKVATEKGEFEQAEKLYERALDSAQKRLGEKDIVVAHIIMEMAEFHLNAHSHEKAYECYLKVRQILAERAEKQDP
ncbi:MAG TPA: tetratricopeptide repeat protein [Planktothrix sp.]|jgi:tetratricopeptide (TPR) repeat protein